MKRNLRFIPSLLLMLSIIVFCGGYYRYMNVLYMNRTNDERLTAGVAAASNAMNATIEEQFALLGIIGGEITANGSKSGSELAESLNIALQNETTHFSLLAYADGGVNATYSTGDVRVLKENIGCALAMQGEKAVMPITFSRLDNKEYMVFYVPITATNSSEISGVLIAGYDINSFRDIITASAGESDAFTLICDKNGKIIICSRGINELNGIENFFSTLSAASIQNKTEAAVQNDLLTLQSNVIKYAYRDAEYYAAYCPIGSNDWIAVRIEAAASVEKDSGFAEQRGYLTLFAAVLSIILGAAWIIQRDRDYAQLDHDSRVNLMISQIKPHFMYNTLSAIIALIDMDPPAAKKMVYNFSKYMRSNIDVLNFDKKVSFSNELSHTRAYVEIEKVRFPNEITVKYNINVDDFLVPPLTIQPIVENAIKHGIHAKRGGTVTVSSTETPEGFVVIVSDDGVGFDTRGASKKATGIDNVRMRLKKMCNGTLEIESTPNVGTTATITVPLSNRINEQEREDSYK